MNGTFFDCEVDNGSSHGHTKSKPYAMTDARARSQRIHELLHNIDEKRNKHLEVFHLLRFFQTPLIICKGIFKEDNLFR